MAVLTEMDVRRILKNEHLTEMIITKDTIITPSARGFLSEKGISLVTSPSEEMTPKVDSIELEVVNDPKEIVVDESVPSESYPLKKIRLKWQFVRIEVVKIQKLISATDSLELIDHLNLVLELVDKINKSLSDSTWVNTSRIEVTEIIEELELSYDMSDIQIRLYELMLMCEEACCETTICFSNQLGTTTREDLVQLEIRLPQYIKSLIIR